MMTRGRDILDGIADVLLDFPTLEYEVRGETGLVQSAPPRLAQHFKKDPARDVKQIMDSLARLRAEACKEYLLKIQEGPGNLTSYHAEWIRRSGLSQSQAVAHGHRNLTEALRLMISYDQLDVSCLASAELLTRYLIQAEIAVERNPKMPDDSGLDIVIAAPTTSSGRASLTKFNNWVSERLKGTSGISTRAR